MGLLFSKTRGPGYTGYGEGRMLLLSQTFLASLVFRNPRSQRPRGNTGTRRMYHYRKGTDQGILKQHEHT